MSLIERGKLALGRDVTLGVLMERLARVHGADPLVEESGTGLKLTYAEAADRVEHMAAGIAARIEPGDRVVVAVPNGYDLFLLCLAASRAGGIAVPVNPQMRPAEIEHVIQDSGATLEITAADDVLGDERLDAAVPASPGDVAAIFYTSGTTGKPKGAQLSHKALLGAITAAALYPSELRRDEAVCGMPVAHIAGFSVLLSIACLGVPLFLLTKFRPDDALDAIESRRATIFMGVPAMYRMMLEAGAEQRDLRSVRLWASGADAIPDDIVRRYKKMGATVTLPVVGKSLGEAMFIDGYGMVELAGGVAIRVSPPGFVLPLLPLPSYQLKVVDDSGNEVSRGQVGELAVKGPGVMKGYHGNDEATQQMLTREGFLRTGDLAKRGLLGQITFAGRKKDVIKHGGYSVFAVEVQESLERHPAVAEAAVIGLPDERKGEVPVAVVRVVDGQSVGEDELIAWAKEQLSEYKVPTRVKIVDELPRTGTDKVQKAELRELFDGDGA